ncbi:hypothetical protein P7C73_g74, partial [Tremellales sp. Uapishka_1]
MFALASLVSCLALPALAAPFGPSGPRGSAPNFASLLASASTGCSTSGLTVPLSGQTTLALPSGQAVSMVTTGRGIQNYTCTGGAYVSVGAVANLYDVSCLLANSSWCEDDLNTVLPTLAFNALSFPDTSGLPVKVHHFFTTSTGTLSPEFATASDHVIASKTASLASPNSTATDVAWLQLTAIAGQGTLAQSVYRLETVNGQPPTSCTTEGTLLSVQYAAMYYFTE